jgi:hypothetical protein
MRVGIVYAERLSSHMYNSLKGLCIFATLVGVYSSAHATLTWDFTDVVTGDQPQGSSWATLTIENTGVDQVGFTLSHNNTSQAPQFITELWMNMSDIPANLAASYSAPITSISWGQNGTNNAGHRWDLNVDLATNNGNRLDVGDSVSWTMTGTGLDEQDFNTFSSPQGQNTPLLGMIHLQGIPGGGSVKLSAVDITSNQPVPEPATLAVLGLGALGLWRRRK